MDRPSRGIGAHPLQVDSLLLKPVEQEPGQFVVAQGDGETAPRAQPCSRY
jgi:hypothetical protein